MSRLILFLSLYLISNNVISQTDSIDSQNSIKIFYDCNYCDVAFIKQNLKQVEFMRDRLYADVHILITDQRNGSGGNTYTINFIGQNKFEGIIDTVSCSTNPNMTDDEIRRMQLKYVEFGLLRYWLRSGLVANIELNISTIDETDIVLEEDPWNNWVFSLYAGGWFDGQESYSSSNINSNVSARRVTEQNKFNFWGSMNQSRSIYKYEDDTTRTKQQSMNMYMSDVFTINDHWSYGIFTDARNSIFSNYKFSTGARVGIEYDLFPYSESANKQLIAYYTIGGRYNDYYDTTVFNKDNELLMEHNLLLGTSLNQKWGSLSGNVSYKNFLHDFALNAIEFYLNFDVRLFKGFSWRINGSYRIQHNQINLAKTGVSIEDVLLQQQQLKSGYNYWFNTGLSYSFGSIYNTIVNPRFTF